MRDLMKSAGLGSLLQRYEKQAKDFVAAFRRGDAMALRIAKRYHRVLPGRPDTNDRNSLSDMDLRNAKVSLADARFIVARRHQFVDWKAFKSHVRALQDGNSETAQFEAAVEAIVTGKASALKQLLRKNPALARARSSREHRATLLHYTAANAVEDYRQKTPKNIVQIAKVLLQAGSEVDADLDYGEMGKDYPERIGSTTLGLAATSCHPADAGVQLPLMDLLLDHGACVDGFPGGWNPVLAALHNGRGEAAAHLARRGAKLDLEGAAGVGRVDRLKTFFSSDGKIKKGATRAQMQAGLLWACEYGRRAAVKFLLEQGADPTPGACRETGLHWAAYSGHAAIVKLLLKANPGVDKKDKRFDGTPLGWALYGWREHPTNRGRKGYYEVVARLARAGATVDPGWLSHPHRGSSLSKVIQADRRMRRALEGKLPPRIAKTR